jgi:chemotaxis protein methyltransferase CheR
MHDDQFRKLLDRFNYSWSGYRKVRKGVKKRLSRHMQELNSPNIAGYLNLLNQNDAVRQEAEKRMTVSISRFFRDRKLWQGLEDGILPRMIEAQKKILRVWSAGCARGEEVYTFKIVWDRLIGKYAHGPGLAITATDMHPDYIEKARAGIYTRSSLKEVPLEIREHYFNICKSGLIFLRNNLLTYYKEHKKNEGLRKVVKALAPHGRLIVGSHEKMPPGVFNFVRNKSIPWAYRQVS